MSTRTVRKDIDRLRSPGYPLHASRGSVGGYQLWAGAELPPLLLEDEEAVAVTLGFQCAAAGAIAGIEDAELMRRLGYEIYGAHGTMPPHTSVRTSADSRPTA